MQIDIGIKESDRERLAAELSKLLADSYTLYLKTHNFHWNVKGPMFQTLHTMFEQQYGELALAVDEIAERIRALGHPAPGTYAAFARLSSITETDGKSLSRTCRAPCTSMSSSTSRPPSRVRRVSPRPVP